MRFELWGHGLLLTELCVGISDFSSKCCPTYREWLCSVERSQIGPLLSLSAHCLLDTPTAAMQLNHDLGSSVGDSTANLALLSDIAREARAVGVWRDSWGWKVGKLNLLNLKLYSNCAWFSGCFQKSWDLGWREEPKTPNCGKNEFWWTPQMSAKLLTYEYVNYYYCQNY